MEDQFDYVIHDNQVHIRTIYEEGSENCIIPSEIEGKPVTRLMDYCCAHNQIVRNATIPNCVTTIGEYAFTGCSNLTSVTIPESIKEIEEGVFEDCESLQSITIPENVEIVGKYAFANCTSLTQLEISSGVTIIEEAAFFRCKIDKLYIPHTVERVKYLAFSKCPDLEMVEFNGFGADTYAFAECPKLKTIEICVNTIYWEPLATYKCQNLCQFIVSEENQAFSSDAGVLLNKDQDVVIRIPDAMSLVTIPDGVTSIGDDAANGNNLKYIDIPKSLQCVGEMAFYECPIIKIVIDSVEQYSQISWYDINSVPGGMNEDNSLPRRKLFLGDQEITDLVIPEGVSYIEDWAFCDFPIRSVILPTTLKQIGDCAFTGTDLTSVEIPECVTKIGHRAFSETKIEKFDITSSAWYKKSPKDIFDWQTR